MMQWYELQTSIGGIHVKNGLVGKGLSILNMCVEAIRTIGGETCRSLVACYAQLGCAHKLCW